MAKRTLPLRAGRRVRWTIEVLPEASAKQSARAKKTGRKPQRARSAVKKAHVPAAFPVEPARPAPAMTAPATQAPSPAQQATWRRAIVPVAAVMLVVAVVAFPRRSSTPAVTAPGVQAEHSDAAGDVTPSAPLIARPPAPTAVPVASSIVATPRPVTEPTTAPVRKHVTNPVTPRTSVAPIGSAAGVADAPKHEEPATKPVALEAPAAAPTSSMASALPAAITLTGCLEVSTDGDTFRLNDVEGVDAPKSRSWRTGFLKKRSAPVILLEPPDRQVLTTNVGRRVAATGQLTNHDLKVSAVHVVGSSCK